MTRSRLAFPSLPVFLLAAAVVALLAFGATRWITDRGALDALPAIEVEGDRAAAAPGALDVNKVHSMRIDTVVAVKATIGGEPMNGTGVVVGRDGTIVTASHVIKDYDRQGLEASLIVVEFPKGDEVVAEKLAIDQINDLAILRIDPTQVEGLVAAPLGDSDQLLVGSEVLAIGNPFGYEFTTTTGIVSATHRVLGSRINAASNITDAVQHDAAINTGNSGGPLFNARGEVVGINQQISTPNGGSVGVSFAVSSNLVRRAIAQYRETRQVRYAELGLRTRDLTPQLARAADLTVTRGAMVQAADGPALAARISTGPAIQHLGGTVIIGDVVVELAGRPVGSSDDLARIAGMIDPDAPVQAVIVRRGGERMEVTIDPTPRAI